MFGNLFKSLLVKNKSSVDKRVDPVLTVKATTTTSRQTHQRSVNTTSKVASDSGLSASRSTDDSAWLLNPLNPLSPFNALGSFTDVSDRRETPVENNERSTSAFNTIKEKNDYNVDDDDTRRSTSTRTYHTEKTYEETYKAPDVSYRDSSESSSRNDDSYSSSNDNSSPTNYD